MKAIPVVFRQYPGGGVVAILPTMPCGPRLAGCMAYDLESGWQRVDYGAVMVSTVAAAVPWRGTPWPIRDALRLMGFSVRAVKRAGPDMLYRRQLASEVG